MITNEQRAEIVGIWKDILRLEEVDLDRPFADAGGTSLMANQLVARIAAELQIQIPVLRVFEYPTLRQLLHFLDEGAPAAASTSDPARPRARAARVASVLHENHDIAVIGMACRLPGANDVEEFWKNLLDGADSIRDIPESALSPTVPDSLRRDPRYVRACGLIADPAGMDAEFFGISPMEAKLTDPQQRHLLELTWQALEHAGEVPGEVGPRTAVFAGVEDNSYYRAEITPYPDAEERAGRFAVMTGNEKDYVAMRIAHRLNLKGPAISVHTACSTSLVAVIMGCKSLREGDCDLALAGGASVHFPTPVGRYFQEGGVFSPDGRTRPFDKDAQGTNFTDGAGMVVLKRMEDALRDGNTIFAVIKGVAINSDGGDKASFSAPSVSGQARCIRAALADADVDAGTIQYLEAHGTATPVGDPIEVEGLRQAYADRADPARLQYCGLGSVKSNIGHTTAAAGVASLIKTALAIHRGVIPSTVHFRQANPGLDLENSPFYVVAEKLDWPRGDTPRRAGISSFGIGGTNSHLILEEAPPLTELASNPIDRPFEIWPVSARSAGQRDSMLTSLEQERLWPRDIAHTLQYGRSRFAHRGARIRLVHRPVDDVLVQPANAALDDPKLVFMFPGQGAQYIGMGRSLHETVPEFRALFEQCCELLSREMGLDFMAFMLDPANQEALQDTRYTQPAMFAIEASLGRMLMDWGIEPQLMIGHSIGEIAAAHLSGVFSLEDAVRLICARGRLMADLPRGQMLSVRGDLSAIIAAAGEPVDVASINSPLHCVLAADFEAIARVTSRLEAAGFQCRLLHTSHAFHSEMMAPAVEPFLQVARNVAYSPPRYTIVSSVRGEVLTAENATDPLYWANHLRLTVRFSAAMFRILQLGGNVLLEVGPRTTLATLAAQHFSGADLAPGKATAISMLADNPEQQAELGGVGAAFARLWCAGIELPWSRIWGGGRRVPLVTSYAFNHKQYLFSEGRVRQEAAVAAPLRPAAAAHPAKASPAVSAGAGVANRRTMVLRRLEKLFRDQAGVDALPSDATFVELGLDSLVLVQIGVELGKAFGTSIPLRDLMKKFNTLAALADHVVASTELGASKEVAPAVAEVTEQSVAPSVAPRIVGADQEPRPVLLERLEKLFSELSGQQVRATQASFVEQGLDSLVLVQIGVEIGKTFGTSVPLRDLIARLNTLPALADHILGSLSTEALATLTGSTQLPARPGPRSPEEVPMGLPAVEVPAGIYGDGVQVLSEQLKQLQSLLTQQLKYMERIALASGSAADTLPAEAPAGSVRDVPTKQASESSVLIRARHAQPPAAGAFRPDAGNASRWITFDPASRHYRNLTG